MYSAIVPSTGPPSDCDRRSGAPIGRALAGERPIGLQMALAVLHDRDKAMSEFVTPRSGDISARMTRVGRLARPAIPAFEDYTGQSSSTIDEDDMEHCYGIRHFCEDRGHQG